MKILQAEVATQLALFLANRPGALTEVCDVVAKAGANIHALTTSDTIDHVVMRMVVDKPRVVLRELEAHGALVVETEVILVEASSHVGSLAALSRQLAAGGVNIEYLYSATPPSSKSGLLVFRPSNIAKALKALHQQVIKRKR